MSMFVCDKCNTLENTALGHYWGRNSNYFGEELKGLALCSECTPKFYNDGSPCRKGGKWHGKFPKRQYTGKEEVINRPSSKGVLPNP